MEDKLNKLIIRSAGCGQAISALLSQEKTPPLPRCRLPVAMAGISEHHHSSRMIRFIAMG
jgi:hypothetical protein